MGTTVRGGNGGRGFFGCTGPYGHNDVPEWEVGRGEVRGG